MSILERLGDLWQLADVRIGAAAVTLSFDQPQYWHFLGLAAEGMGDEAAMVHGQHFIGVAAEGLRRHGQPALACALAWLSKTPGCAAIAAHGPTSPPGSMSVEPSGLRRCNRSIANEAVSLAVAAILAADE